MRENIIQITPIVGEHETPDFIAVPIPHAQPFISKPNTNINITVNASELIIDAQTAGFVTPFQITPNTNGPIKQPASVPQESPVIYAIAVIPNSSLRIARITDIQNAVLKTCTTTILWMSCTQFSRQEQVE